MTPAEVMEWADAIGYCCAYGLGLAVVTGVLAVMGWLLFREVR